VTDAAAAGISLIVVVPPLHPATAMTVMTAALAAPAMGFLMSTRAQPLGSCMGTYWPVDGQ
jgi:hypothetical protein